MAIHLFEENEPITVNGLVTVIFGDPGIGKTSLAMQVDKGFLIDFDGGLHRAKNKCKAVRLDSWSDMVEVQNTNMVADNGIKTLIIDTAGTMLDNFISQAAMKSDIKNRKADGALSLQGYGALKNIFNQFTAWSRSQNVNLIFVCHAEQFKEGDDVKYRPKMTGGSYDILVQQADLMGYMNSRNNQRTLEFNHTDKHVGKNTAEFGLLTIPEYTSPEFAGYMQRIIDATKSKILALSQEQVEVMEKITRFKDTIEGIVKPEEIEAIRLEVMNEPNAIQLQVVPVLKKQMLNVFADFITEVNSPEQAAAIVEDANQLHEIFSNGIKRALIKHCLSVNIVYNVDKKAFEVKIPETIKAPEKTVIPGTITHEKTGKDGKHEVIVHTIREQPVARIEPIKANVKAPVNGQKLLM